jgi:hypothetical protein
VFAFGRLSLFGPGATRLHDQLISVASQWLESKGAGHLRPFADEADRRAQDRLEESLKESPTLEAVSPLTQVRHAASAPGDFATLWPHIRDEADAKAVDLTDFCSGLWSPPHAAKRKRRRRLRPRRRRRSPSTRRSDVTTRVVGSVAAALTWCVLSCGGAQAGAPAAQVDRMPVQGFVVFDPGPNDGGRDTYTILRTTIAQCGDECLAEDTAQGGRRCGPTTARSPQGKIRSHA